MSVPPLDDAAPRPIRDGGASVRTPSRTSTPTPAVPEGVSRAAWEAIGARVVNARWETPERNAEGEITGWVERHERANGKAKKISKAGSKRGLTFVPPLPNYAGTSPHDPIFVVEGQTDTAAGLTIGLDVVGRPSVSGGASELSMLLADRHICFILENDGKTPGSQGPGQIHGLTCARKLVGACASVRTISPPPGIKDLRAWILAGATPQDIHAAARAATPLAAADKPRDKSSESVKAIGAGNMGFSVNKHGRPFATPPNIRIGLAKLGVTLEHDEFCAQDLIHGLEGFGPHLDDRALIRMRLLLEEEFDLTVGKNFFADVVMDLAMQKRRHPVREYLGGLTWDGTPRLDLWLVTYAGAANSEYVRAVGRLVLVAAVRRVRKPGCKFDEMPVLEGPQGDGKSSLLATLAVREEWFTDDLPLNAGTQRQMEAMAGRWIIEAAELQGMRKGEVETLKAFLSRRVDRARLAYGRLPTEARRQCVIAGTTNSNKYLKDISGNRRFWPVRCGMLKLAELARDRDQLWAEAAAREAKGESIRLEPRLYPAAAAAQEVRVVNSVFYEILEPLIGGKTGRVLAEDLWRVLGKKDKGCRRPEDMHLLGETMQRLGWERDKVRFGGPDPQWGYLRGDEQQRKSRLVFGIDTEGNHAAVDEIPA